MWAKDQPLGMTTEEAELPSDDYAHFAADPNPRASGYERATSLEKVSNYRHFRITSMTNVRIKLRRSKTPFCAPPTSCGRFGSPAGSSKRGDDFDSKVQTQLPVLSK
jgi:hypothetical protein